MRREQEERKNIVKVLEDGEAFYDVSYGEVKVIVHVSELVTDVFFISVCRKGHYLTYINSLVISGSQAPLSVINILQIILSDQMGKIQLVVDIICIHEILFFTKQHCGGKLEKAFRS